MSSLRLFSSSWHHLQCISASLLSLYLVTLPCHFPLSFFLVFSCHSPLSLSLVILPCLLLSLSLVTFHCHSPVSSLVTPLSLSLVTLLCPLLSLFLVTLPCHFPLSLSLVALPCHSFLSSLVTLPCHSPLSLSLVLFLPVRCVWSRRHKITSSSQVCCTCLHREENLGYVCVVDTLLSCVLRNCLFVC